MKKVKNRIIIFIILVILIFGYCTYLEYRGKEILNRNSITIVEEIPSPNKKYKAIIFLDKGNATVATNIRVAITKNHKNKFYDSDIIFLQNRIDNLSVSWENDSELVVKYTEGEFSEIIKQINKLGNINITYKKNESIALIPLIRNNIKIVRCH